MQEEQAPQEPQETEVVEPSGETGDVTPEPEVETPTEGGRANDRIRTLVEENKRLQGEKDGLLQRYYQQQGPPKQDSVFGDETDQGINKLVDAKLQPFQQENQQLKVQLIDQAMSLKHGKDWDENKEAALKIFNDLMQKRFDGVETAEVMLEAAMARAGIQGKRAVVEAGRQKQQRTAAKTPSGATGEVSEKKAFGDMTKEEREREYERIKRRE